MSLVATVGWILFLIFGSIGMIAMPLDWIREFIGRPRSTITKKQYVERAKDLAVRAKDIQYVAEGMKRQQKESGRSRKWRKNFSALQAQVTVLEEDQAQLERVYPQGEDPSYSWAITVMMFWVKLVLGVLAVAITITWVLQIILYILIDPPVTPLLNTAFIQCVCVSNSSSYLKKMITLTLDHLFLCSCRANDVFPLFGTILFGIFVFYLQLAVVKGNFKFGLNVLIFRVHPIRKGATVMSSFLFNVALILVATTATIQFAATAFALYANNTTILNIFGNTVRCFLYDE
jgi:LMBR1 domain-containing protein 1